MACSCISYNRPQPYQTTPSRILTTPDWAQHHRETISVDECIADTILALWDARIWTLNCCCGHNGEFDRGVIVDRSDRERAAAVLRSMGETAQVLAWELVAGDASPPALVTGSSKVLDMSRITDVLEPDPSDLYAESVRAAYYRGDYDT